MVKYYSFRPVLKYNLYTGYINYYKKIYIFCRPHIKKCQDQ